MCEVRGMENWFENPKATQGTKYDGGGIGH